MLRSLFALLALAFCMCLGQAASASPSFVDRRVSALSDAALLSSSPQALLDERRQAVSLRFTAWTRPLFFLWTLSMIGVLVYLWMSGRAARIRDMLKRSIRSPVALRFAYGAVLAATVGAASLPLLFIRYRILSVYELTAQPAESWLRDQVVTLTLDALLSGLVTAFVLTLVARTSLWYVHTALGIVLFSFFVNYVEPLMIAPLYNVYRPLSISTPLGAQLQRFKQRAGLGDVPIYVDDQSKQTPIVNANVSGYGAMRRIVLGDNLLKEATPREIFFIVAHEMGHSVRHDMFRMTLVGTLLLLLVAAIAVGIADHIGFRRDDDELSRLALVAALLGAIGLFVFPLFNFYSRHVEAKADAFALGLTGDRAAAVRAFVRFGDEGLMPYCPPKLVRFYFYDHPPIGSRIAAALGRPDPCP